MPRNTIKKYLNADMIVPLFTTQGRHSKLDPFAQMLAGWLKTQACKSRKQRRTLKQLFADLVACGFTGSYVRVAAFAMNWRADRQWDQQMTECGADVPLAVRPRKAFQSDGRISKSSGFCRSGLRAHKACHVACIKAPHSRAFLGWACLLQSGTRPVQR